MAETFNLDVWVGDPRRDDRSDNADDSYVMATAAAVAAVTTHIRIGVFLTLDGSAEPLRLAEDIGVVDQAARGRIELGLVAPALGDHNSLASWEASAKAMLNAWHHWPTTTGRSVATTPRPAQPWVPRLVAGPPEVAAIADRVRGGVVLFESDVDGLRSSSGDDGDDGSVARRTVLAVRPPVPVRDWLAPDPLGEVTSLRAAVDTASAHEVMVLLDAGGGQRLVDDMEALGIVVGTGLRCSAHHAPYLVPDAWRWLTERGDLHHAPL
jgi:alkanesulfonate monooxygenase SsuD/methylene tetrahydromethanopterin reductase-like flavin-dependent oxidoreductase (luciferase family)